MMVPLLQQHEAEAIEVWTDAELSALHAAWFVAKSPAQKERIHRAVVWHLEHLQPDNATNRPWAIHVFYLHGTPEAEHHAATLIHNVQASGGTTLAGLKRKTRQPRSKSIRNNAGINTSGWTGHPKFIATPGDV